MRYVRFTERFDCRNPSQGSQEMIATSIRKIFARIRAFAMRRSTDSSTDHGRADKVTGGAALSQGLRFGLLAALVAACVGGGHAPAQADERSVRKVKVGGMTREYIVHLPADLSARGEWPVIMAFHPGGGTAKFMEETTNLHRAAAGEFIVVYPDGYRRRWNAGGCCGPAMERDIDDLGFYRAILADLDRIVPVAEKAHVTGYSNGSMMVYHLVCNLPQLVVAAAPFAGLQPMQGATLPMTDCNPGRVPLMHIHGGADAGSPVEGGFARSSQLRDTVGQMAPALDVVRLVAKRNSCSIATKQVRSPNLGTSCTMFTGCGRAEVGLCVVPGLGHVWPGAPAGVARMGDARTDLDGSLAIVNFFRRH
jgi:polyhydroxybutyrate depolymerase